MQADAQPLRSTPCKLPPPTLLPAWLSDMAEWELSPRLLACERTRVSGCTHEVGLRVLG